MCKNGCDALLPLKIPLLYLVFVIPYSTSVFNNIEYHQAVYTLSSMLKFPIKIEQSLNNQVAINNYSISEKSKFQRQCQY